MFKDKIVFVSGGTGYIGAEICRNFNELGAKVIFSYNKKEEKAQKLLEELNNAVAVQINIKDVNDIHKKINEVVENVGAFDVLVNNAAVSHILPFAMLEEDDVDAMFDINIKGTLFVTKAAVRGMIRKKSGTIVNIGSIAGHRMLDVPVTYAMAKASIAGMTVALASELKKFNIRVNNIIPGLMEGGVSKGVPEDLKNVFVEHCAVGRAGLARDVSELVCFVASGKASYINGQNLFVDGGI